MNHLKLFPLLVLSAACGSQVDGGHQGKILASLDGTMHSAAPSQSVRADVSIVWVIGSGGTSFVGADHVEVEDTLPSNFQLSVFTPPSDDMMFDWNGIRFGTAYIASNRAGEDWQNWQGWLGADMDHVLVYLPASPPVDSDVAALLRGAPAAGFHVYDVHHVTEAERQERLACGNTLGFGAALSEVFTKCGGTANDDLIPSQDDLATLLSIEVVAEFGLDEFNKLPSWYGL